MKGRLVCRPAEYGTGESGDGVGVFGGVMFCDRITIEEQNRDELGPLLNVMQKISPVKSCLECPAIVSCNF